MASLSARLKSARRDGFRRETFSLPREAAREKAREMFARYPKAGDTTAIESWRELPDGGIEFTMRRLPSADWDACGVLSARRALFAAGDRVYGRQACSPRPSRTLRSISSC